MVGYLFGYDGDERHHVYIPNKRVVIVSRDVVSNEKIRGCKECVILPIKDDIEDVDQRKFDDTDEENRRNRTYSYI